jgi:hypothetical protein
MRITKTKKGTVFSTRAFLQCCQIAGRKFPQYIPPAVRNYHNSLPNSPEECIYHLLRGGRLISRMSRDIWNFSRHLNMCVCVCIGRFLAKRLTLFCGVVVGEYVYLLSHSRLLAAGTVNRQCRTAEADTSSNLLHRWTHSSVRPPT